MDIIVIMTTELNEFLLLIHLFIAKLFFYL
jgi:hypothetical protein